MTMMHVSLYACCTYEYWSCVVVLPTHVDHKDVEVGTLKILGDFNV